MKSLVLLLCLVATTASAQQSEAPRDSEFAPFPGPPAAPPLVSAPAEAPTNTPPQTAPSQGTWGAPSESANAPPDESAQVAPAPPAAAPRAVPGSVGPAESPGQRAMRYSRASSNLGGGTLIVTEALSGIVGGAMLGSSRGGLGLGGGSAFTSATLGGFALGSLGALYQYFIPVGRHEGLLTAGAATTGFIAALALSSDYKLDSGGRALFTVAASQVGVATVLLATSGQGDVSDGDMALVGMSSVYACVFASLIEYLHADHLGQSYSFTPMLVAPAVGMAIGGLLSIPMELDMNDVVEAGGLPLSVGLMTLWIGSRFASGPALARATLISVGTTLLITSLAIGLAAEPHPPLTASAHTSATAGQVEAVPVPVVMTAGLKGDALAAGPGLFVRF